MQNRANALGAGTGARGAAQRGNSVEATARRTVNRLQPMSERGARIREDMEGMMSDYFSGAAPPQAAGPASNDPKPIRGALPSIAASNGRGTGSNITKYSSYHTSIPRQFEIGPQNPDGRMFVASDRNLLCADLLGPLCVVGSADHGLKVFDVTNGREKRNLYTKKFGHTEWVTTCRFLGDGRIISGGMDSKLCLWHASALRCDDLLGHTGSISEVDVNDDNIAVSAAYDRTLRVWNCNEKRCIATLTGHSNPVMSFAWEGAMLMSGDRKGGVKFWDMNTTECIGNFESKGQVGALGHIVSETMGCLSFVGDQGGAFSVFDVRRTGTNPVFREILHPGGVVALAAGLPHLDKIVTAGADKRMLCLDTRMDLAIVHEWTDHRDFIYSLKTFGNLVLSGGGNGWLLAHDAVSGKCCYGLGANKAAVRSIMTSQQNIVCAGDDGTAVVYDYMQ